MATSNRPSFQPPTAEEIRAARARGKEALKQEPHAASVVFDSRTRRFHVELTTGSTFSFAVEALREMEGASDEQLATVRVVGVGSTLEWPSLDQHISVAGLILDLFGGEEWKKALRTAVNRQVSRSGSEARAKASRENGRKGGRPRKAG